MQQRRPDGQRIVTASDDGTRIWDLRRGMQLAVLQHPDQTSGSAQDNVYIVQFSPTGNRIITASSHLLTSTIRIWNLNGINGIESVVLPYDMRVASIQFSSDGQQIITAQDSSSFVAMSNNVLTWILNSAGEVTLQKTFTVTGVTSAQFSPDNQHILTASNDGTAKIWDLDGNELVALRGHQSRVSSAQFSPDGQQIVTASDDRTARIWDLNGRQLAILEGHQGTIKSAQFSFDGRLVVTASNDRTARVWKVESLEQLLARGCRWLQAYLPYIQDVSESDRQLCNTSISSPQQQ